MKVSRRLSRGASRGSPSEGTRTRRSFLYAGGRVLLASLFVGLALSRVADLRGAGAGAELNVFGLGGVLVAVAIAVELSGGVILGLGWKVRTTAAVLLGYVIALTAILAPDVTSPVGRATLVSHVAILAGLMMLRARGPGSRSLDHVLESRSER